MTDMPQNPADSGQMDVSPALMVNAQYIKDLSFENPNPLDMMQPQQKAPRIDVDIQVQAGNVSGQTNRFEVTLNIHVNANTDNKTLFLLDLSYCGVFTIENCPDELLRPVLYVECPRLLFPFARSIVANLTTDGGFPPLYLAPVNFAELYYEQMMQQQAEGGDAVGSSDGAKTANGTRH